MGVGTVMRLIAATEQTSLSENFRRRLSCLPCCHRAGDPSPRAGFRARVSVNLHSSIKVAGVGHGLSPRFAVPQTPGSPESTHLACSKQTTRLPAGVSPGFTAAGAFSACVSEPIVGGTIFLFHEIVVVEQPNKT